MTDPKIEIFPARPAANSGRSTTLDVLVRITPPAPEVHFVRPPINLGLVLDRSGSMAARKKMDYARKAATFAVEQLLPSDQVSVTVFDNVVETIHANAPASDKATIARAIAAVQPRHTTALHAGWKEGADQVERHQVTDGLNRVILLSDGLANEGMTDPEAIAGECHARSLRGVSTTTMGLGEDYNEDLMQKMGERGDGNYYFIEDAAQLADIFHTELNGLMANVGTKVSLGIEPQSGASVVEVLNDADRNSFGRLMLPNLIVAMPIQVVFRLNVPPLGHASEVCRIRLAWDDPKTGQRRSLYAALSLPTAAPEAWDALPVDPAVSEQVAIQMAARAKKEALAAFDAGDIVATRAGLGLSAAYLGAMPASPELLAEMAEMDEIAAHLDEGQKELFRKKAAFGLFRRKRGMK